MKTRLTTLLTALMLLSIVTFANDSIKPSKQLQKELKQFGDVEVFTEDNDGRSTSASRVELSKWRPTFVSHREIWKGHSDGKRHFINL